MKYKVAYTEEVWHTVEVEAGSDAEALEKFWLGEFDDATIKITGGEIQDSVEVYEEDEA